MLNIKEAVASHRYWRTIVQTQTENTAPIDRSGMATTLAQYNPMAQRLLGQLDAEGIAVVPNYWTEEQCATARSEIDRLIAEFPDACRLFSEGSDKRLFGVEMVSDLLAQFHHDPFLKGMGEAHGGLELYNFATLGAKIEATKANNGSGDGWHRDGFGFQYKSIIYLSDVTSDNGPFELLPRSHKPWRVTADTAIGGLPAAPQSRMTPSHIDRLTRRFHVPRERYIASAGTLLLVNTACIHRGSPLNSGSRYALTNYYFHPYQIDAAMVEKFNPMMPGTAARVMAMLASRQKTHS